MLVDQHASEHARSTALGQQGLGEGERAARIQNIVDDDDVAAFNRACDIVQNFHRALRDNALAVAREVKKIDLRRQPLAMQRPDQIRGKDEAAFEDGDDQRLFE